ncbi:TRAP transporter permease [Pseudogemmobacter humi]|uniref:Sialic acid TRAP transporter permease protein SiaT n=1 Tax=Pseudogemmobacter humi TaxID=2483812 RepID=A0A3P5X7R8_9RHOB|nr:TRAP transporter permease [Pseudogemmobacter humi]VDC24459.1 Sialic acid TRAP transporter permease protein SiaT [Pseudogemmobacter humi]
MADTPKPPPEDEARAPAPPQTGTGLAEPEVNELGERKILSNEEVLELEEKFDPEVRFRPLGKTAGIIAAVALFALSVFHYYTAGFGLLREVTHRAVHMSFVLSLIFLVFGARKANYRLCPASALRPAGIPLYDWILMAIAAVTTLYVPWVFSELAFRVGNPSTLDLAMGTGLIVVLLEATRRAMGWPLPVIAVIMILYAMYGRHMPGLLVHPGASWASVVNHLYLTSQGIYGLPVGVVATYVFHFVLFGVLATRMGLGQLFIDGATAIAGRLSGGPAKVSVVSSAMMGTITGSSIANAVTTGALTIPAMMRVGYSRHFAAAVEAAASAGGQITPPIMGAAAFLMIEFLGIPYTHIMVAALVPAFMHFFGVLMQVHFEARRRGLRGLTKEEMPQIWKVLKRDWPTLIPLFVLVGVLMNGNTPYLAAFWGITLCVVIGLVNPANRITISDVFVAFVTGAKYALAVGAAAATVGIIIGIFTLTGVSFKVSYIVTQTASDWAGAIIGVIPFGIMTIDGLTLFITLLLTAVVCIVMGTGVPTTANYLIMVTVAAPILAMLGVQGIVAHFFVFYYGILADITPPVALAAYATAGIANANPFSTGLTAFRLSMGKALVPFVFVFSPSMLIMVENFTWGEFALAVYGCTLGIVALSAAFSDYMTDRLFGWERWVLALTAFLLIAPELYTTLIGTGIFAVIWLRPVVWRKHGGVLT